MTSLSSIVIDEDAIATHHPALEEGVRLARRCGAHLKIVDVLPWVPSGLRHFVTADIEKELVDHRRERLAALLVKYSDTDRAKAAQLAQGFSHSWEIAQYAYDPPTERPCVWLQLGKMALDGVAWRGALDPNPASTSYKIYQNAKKTRSPDNARIDFYRRYSSQCSRR